MLFLMSSVRYDKGIHFLWILSFISISYVFDCAHIRITIGGSHPKGSLTKKLDHGGVVVSHAIFHSECLSLLFSVSKGWYGFGGHRGLLGKQLVHLFSGFTRSNTGGEGWLL